MARHLIGWLPGDGIGVDVLDAARIVLDRLALDAEYVHGDIGWDCWCREGDPLPPRTIELLRRVNAALFGAITSKPTKQAEAELKPELRGTGLVYRSPIVRMRQMFDLYNCLRPCKSYAGNPINYKHPIDLVVFRENTEDLYAGVEFSPVPADLAEALGRLTKTFAPLPAPPDDCAVSCKINTRRSDASSGHLRVRETFSGRKSRSCTRLTWCAQPTGCSSRWRKTWPGAIPASRWTMRTWMPS
jgi:3-isopropylmalate dehydrogenase